MVSFRLQDIFMVTRNQLTGVGVVRYCYYGHGCGRRNDGRCHGRGSCPVPRQDSETKPCSKECWVSKYKLFHRCFDAVTRHK